MKASDEGVTVVSEMVFPPQTNHYGTLFGGEALKLIGKAAFIAASRHTHTDVVMKSEATTFHEPVRQGDLAEVLARVVETGRTSLTIDAELYSESLHTGERRLCCAARYIMVAVDNDGRPIPHVSQPANGGSEEGH